MRRWFFLLGLLLIAARSPNLNDPQATYMDGERTVCQPANGSVEVQLIAPAEVTSSRRFMVRVRGILGGGGNVVSLRGNLFYDSLLVRPTGRVDDPFWDGNGNGMTANRIEAGSQIPNRCGIAPAANKACIEGLHWQYWPSGKEYQYSYLFGVEFTAIAPGTATFSWTAPDVGCVEPTIAVDSLDIKPTSVVWYKTGLYYASSAADTTNYNVTNASVTVLGNAVTASYFWPDHPSYYENYFSFDADTVSASNGDTILVGIKQWTPTDQSLDSLSVTTFWDGNALTFLGTQQSEYNWTVTTGQSFAVGDLTSRDSIMTSVCGIDSAAGQTVWMKTRGTNLFSYGTIVYLKFTVDRADTSVMKFSCDRSGTYEISDSAFPRNTLAFRANWMPPIRPLFPFEKPQDNWRWRYGESNQLVIMAQ